MFGNNQYGMGPMMPNQGSSVSMAYAPDTDVNTIRFRLDVKPLIQDLQVYLTGRMERIVEMESGELRREVYQCSKPKVNDDGLQAIMFAISTTINSQTVQGNLTDEMYREFIADFHEGLSHDLFINSQKYGISDDDFNGIVGNIVNCVRLFVTRPIANKEREALGQSQRVSENVIVQPQKKGWGKLVPF